MLTVAEHDAHPNAHAKSRPDRSSSCCGRRAALVVMAMAVARGSGSAWAGELAPPTSEVLLTARGLLGRRNFGDEARLDRNLLEHFGTARLTTWTPWTEGEIELEGLPLRSLVAGLEAGGTAMLARALNDYHVEIPMSDAQDYDMLIAWSADGIELTRRDQGPLWIVYPWSAHPELDMRITSQRSVWQLYELVFYEKE